MVSRKEDSDNSRTQVNNKRKFRKSLMVTRVQHHLRHLHLLTCDSRRSLRTLISLAVRMDERNVRSEHGLSQLHLARVCASALSVVNSKLGGGVTISAVGLDLRTKNQSLVPFLLTMPMERSGRLSR